MTREARITKSEIRSKFEYQNPKKQVARTTVRFRPLGLGPLIVALIAFISGVSSTSLAAEPLRALLITGGCCHDYEAQKKILSEGISSRANVEWTIIHEGKDRTDRVSIYAKPDWAKGF